MLLTMTVEFFSFWKFVLHGKHFLVKSTRGTLIPNAGQGQERAILHIMWHTE